MNARIAALAASPSPPEGLPNQAARGWRDGYRVAIGDVLRLLGVSSRPTPADGQGERDLAERIAEDFGGPIDYAVSSRHVVEHVRELAAEMADPEVTEEPMSPETTARLISAADAALRVRRNILLLAAHASGHKKRPHSTACEECREKWPCVPVMRAAGPSLNAVADLPTQHGAYRVAATDDEPPREHHDTSADNCRLNTSSVARAGAFCKTCAADVGAGDGAEGQT